MNFLLVIAASHFAASTMHMMLVRAFFPFRDENYISRRTFQAMSLCTVYHFFSFLEAFFTLEGVIELQLLSRFLYNSIACVCVAYVIPIFLANMSKLPGPTSGFTTAMFSLSHNHKALYYFFQGIAVIAIFRNWGAWVMPDALWLPYFAWFNPLNMLSLIGIIWTIMLLSGLRIVSEGVWGRPVLNLVFALMLILYAVTNFSAYGKSNNSQPLLDFFTSLSTVPYFLVFCWFRFRHKYLDVIIRQSVQLALLLVAMLLLIIIVSDTDVSEESQTTIFVTAAVIMIALLYLSRWLDRFLSLLWVPSANQGDIQTALATRLSSCVTETQSIESVEEYLASLFSTSVAINQVVLDEAEVIEQDNFKLHLGYIKNIYPWFSQSINVARIALDHLSSHLKILQALDEQKKQILRIQELSELAIKAELTAMKAQIRPHFLFNTLNTIHAFTKDDPTQAEHIIEQLAKLMRRVLTSSSTNFYSLSEEIELAEIYLGIEKARHGSRFDYVIDSSEHHQKISIPAFSLQPLVENAVKHGVERQLDKTELGICTRVDETQLTLTVWQTGPGLDAPSSLSAEHGGENYQGAGMALNNIRQRLSRLYSAGEASLVLRNRAQEGIEAILSLPLNSSPVTELTAK